MSREREGKVKTKFKMNNGAEKRAIPTFAIGTVAEPLGPNNPMYFPPFFMPPPFTVDMLQLLILQQQRLQQQQEALLQQMTSNRRPSEEEEEETKGKDDSRKKMKRRREQNTCRYCGKVYYHRNSFNYHQSTHLKTTFICHENGCSKMFSAKSSLTRHLRVGHNLAEEEVQHRYS